MAPATMSSVTVARVAAEAALEVTDVLGMHGGTVGEIATYGGGRRVRGVRVHDRPSPRMRLHLIIRYGGRVAGVADDVRASVRKALEATAPEFSRGLIDIHIAEVRTDDEAPPAGPPEEPVRWS